MPTQRTFREERASEIEQVRERDRVRERESERESEPWPFRHFMF